MRGLAEQAESTESERFKEPTGPLLSAREVSPRTGIPGEEALKRRDGGSLSEMVKLLLNLSLWFYTTTLFDGEPPVLHTHPITLIHASRRALLASAVLHRINSRCVFIWTPPYLEPSLTWSRRVESRGQTCFSERQSSAGIISISPTSS